MAALAACRDGPRANPRPKLDHRHKTVPQRPIPLLRLMMRARSERRQRAPERCSESHRNARGRIAEALDDIPRQALEAIDVTPRRFPGAEIRSQFVGGFGKILQESLRRNLCADLVAEVDACLPGVRP